MAMAMNMTYARCDTFLLYLGEIMISGIYRIYSIATDESYYGSSKHIKRRFIEHRFKWRNNKGNHKVRLLLNKYGLDNFRFEILEECLPFEFQLKEKKYMDSDPRNLNVWIDPFTSKGCNLGTKVKGKKYFGTPHTEETKIRHGEIMKEYYKTHDSYWKGRSIPEETRDKISKKLKEYFSKNDGPNKGKSPSEETRKKISETLKKRRGVL